MTLIITLELLDSVLLTMTIVTTPSNAPALRITTTIYLLLLCLHLKGPLSLTDACTLTLLKVPTMHALCITLTREGLIIVDRSAFVPVLHLTDFGRSLVAPYLPAAA